MAASLADSADSRSLPELVDDLRGTSVFRDYDQAFRVTTGLPLLLVPPGELEQLRTRPEDPDNPFCRLINRTGFSCETCRRLTRDLADQAGLPIHRAEAAAGTHLPPDPVKTQAAPGQCGGLGADGRDQPITVTCFAAMCETLVPVRVGDRTVAYLKTGLARVGQPTQAAFAASAQRLRSDYPELDAAALEQAFFDSPATTPDRYQAMIQLLRSFAVHLGSVSNRLLMERTTREPVQVTRAKAWIARHYADPVTLDDVAGAVHASSYHFSRLFRKATELTFSEYLARYRVEQAKQRLLDRNKRVSEVAFAVGFQSLAPFNRAFRRYAGQSPSAWRAADGSRG